MTKVMNNFYYNLPGGDYRTEYSDDPEKKVLFEAIDCLLEAEFPDLDVEEPMQAINIANKTIGAYFKDRSEEALAAAKQAEKTKSEAKDKIRPVYQRLLELGYDNSLLVS